MNKTIKSLMGTNKNEICSNIDLLFTVAFLISLPERGLSYPKFKLFTLLLTFSLHTNPWCISNSSDTTLFSFILTLSTVLFTLNPLSTLACLLLRTKISFTTDCNSVGILNEDSLKKKWSNLIIAIKKI